MSIGRSSSSPAFGIVAQDFKQVLEELALQADRVLANLEVLREMDKIHSNILDTTNKREAGEMMRLQVGMLEMDLGVIKLDAELVTDEQISDWVACAAGGAEREQREDFASGFYKRN
ncbi:Nn.00g083500.m01.CDS01 [Neocucurbitaria sp. VM-36]